MIIFLIIILVFTHQNLATSMAKVLQKCQTLYAFTIWHHTMYNKFLTKNNHKIEGTTQKMKIKIKG